MINPQWLELPMSRTNFHGPKDVRAIEVPLYLNRRVFIMATINGHAQEASLTLCMFGKISTDDKLSTFFLFSPLN